jgi:cobalt-precorrin 5A hydrolase/precorrin-3B C17-methyltransferase
MNDQQALGPLQPESGPRLTDSNRVALGFSKASTPILKRLQQSGLISSIRWPSGAPDPESDPLPEEAPLSWLQRHWSTSSAVVAVGACGLVTRLIAPLLDDKQRDPAVLVIDPQGRFVIPLLGSHAAGADQLSHEIAALLGAEVVITGSSGSEGRLALDAFGGSWGWRRGSGDWNRLMRQLAADRLPVVHQSSGLTLWQELEAAGPLRITGEQSDAEGIWIGPERGEGCRWHPPCLWLGIGCERHTSAALLQRLVDDTLAREMLAPEAVAGLASIDRKGDEPALLELAESMGWPLRLFSAEQLAAVPVPNPSAVVEQEMGTASVAEAAALLASGASDLRIAKTIARAQADERGAATLAVAVATGQWAPQRGGLHLVGSGPGTLDLLSPDARRALARATVWVGYSLYLDLIEPLRRPDQLRREGRLTQERARCAEALQLAQAGMRVALISSGDSGIYGMAGLALELWLQQPHDHRPAFAVHPGLSALQLAAARAGAPLMHDFCTISLSDRLTPWAVIEQRLQAAAAGDFVVALYNPRSRDRDWQLPRALELLAQERPASTPVVLARQLGRSDESVSLHRLGELPVEQVDMLTLLLIGNRSSLIRDGVMVTPRGYPGAELA